MRKEAGELAALEARYWHGFNDLQLHVRAHAEERAVLLRRVRAAGSARGGRTGGVALMGGGSQHRMSMENATFCMPSAGKGRVG